MKVLKRFRMIIFLFAIAASQNFGQTLFTHFTFDNTIQPVSTLAGSYLTSIVGTGATTGGSFANNVCNSASSSYGIFGNTNTGLVFNSGSAYQFSSQEMSISVWVNTFDRNASQVIFSNYSNSPTGIILGLTTGGVYFKVNVGTGGGQAEDIILTPANIIENGTWTHILVSYIKNQASKIYVNGIERATFNAQNKNFTNTFPNTAAVGFLHSDNSLPFNGYIDELRIFDGGLDAAEALNEFRTIGFAVATFPGSVSICTGSDVSLGINTLSGSNLTVQWARNGNLLDSTSDGGLYGSTYDDLSLQFPASSSLSGSVFTATISGSCNVLTSGLINTTVLQSTMGGSLSRTSLSTCQGTSFDLTVSSTAGENLKYIWRRNSANLTSTFSYVHSNSYTTTSLNFNNIPATLSGIYSLSIAGTCGSVTIGGFTFSGLYNTSVTSLPSTVNYCEDVNSAVMSFNTVSGSNLALAWGVYDSGVGGFIPLVASGTLSGLNTTSLTFTGFPNGIAPQYNVTVSGACGTSILGVSSLQMLPKTRATIASGDQVCPGISYLGVIATISGAAPLSYRWYRSVSSMASFSSISDANLGASVGTVTTSLFRTNITEPSFTTILGLNISTATGMNNNRFAISVSGACGSIITTLTSFFSITINSNLDYTSPVASTVCLNGNSIFTTSATATGLNFIWERSIAGVGGWNTIVSGGSSPQFAILTTSGFSNLSVLGVPSTITSMLVRTRLTSSCAAATTSGVGFTLQIPPTVVTHPVDISTCDGKNLLISASLVGTSLSYAWQVNTGAGWYLLPSDLYNSEGMSVSGISTNTLILQNVPLILSGKQVRLAADGLCTPSTTTTAATLQVHANPLADLLGLESSYCTNSSRDTLQAFTSVASTGTWAINPNIFSSLNAVGTGGLRRSLNPGVFSTVSNTPFAITYITAPDANGCVTTITKSSIVYTIPSSLTITNPSQSSYLSTSDPEPILGTTFPGTIFSTSGNGVANNYFYPSAILGSTNIRYNLTNTFTGCTNFTNKSINVINSPGDVLNISPAPPLSDYSFCSDDNATYTITINAAFAPNGKTIPGVSINIDPNYCYRWASINGATSFVNSLSGHGFGITGTYGGGIYQFTPSVYASSYGLTSPNSTYLKNFYLFYDKSVTTVSGTVCGSTFDNNPQFFNLQPFLVFGKPSPPAIPVSRTLCSGQFSPTLTFGTAGSNIKWYYSVPGGNYTQITSLSGTSVTLQQLGITTNTGFGFYQFGVSQSVNGCQSIIVGFSVTINRTPNPPSNNSTYGGYCLFQPGINPILQSDSSAIGQIRWYTATNSFIQTSPTYAPFIDNQPPARTFLFKARYLVNGCESVQFTDFPVIVNDAPPTPEVIANVQNCVGETTFVGADMNAFITLVGVNSVLGFNWYDTPPFNYFATVLGTGFTTSLSGGVFSNTFPGQTFMPDQFSKKYYVKAVFTTTGCISRNSATVTLNAYKIPLPPTYSAFFDTLCTAYNDSDQNNPFYPTLRVSSYLNYTEPLVANFYGKPNRTDLITTLGFTIGNVSNFPTRLAIPVNRSWAYNVLDTTFYATQSYFGCESTVAALNFKMHGRFRDISTNNMGALPTLAMPNLSNEFCVSSSNIGVVSIAGYQLLSIAGVLLYTEFNQNIGDFTSELTLPVEKDPKNLTLKYKQYKGHLNRCFSKEYTFNVKTNPIPTAPTVSQFAYCVPYPMSPLSFTVVTASGGVPTLSWYAQVDDAGFATSLLGVSTLAGVGMGSFTGTYFPDFFAQVNTILGTSLVSDAVTLFATHTEKGCESLPTKTSVTYYNQLGAPATIQPDPICSGEPVKALVASGAGGSQMYWYSSHPGTINGVGSPVYLGDNFVPPISNTISGFNASAPGIDYVYFVRQRNFVAGTTYPNFDGCMSLVASVVSRVNAIPSAPTSTQDLWYCSGDIIQPITAAGTSGIVSELKWYTSLADVSDVTKANATGAIFAPPVSSSETSVPTTLNYYTTQSYQGCQSDPLVINLRIQPLPVLNFVGLNPTYCQYNPISVLYPNNTLSGISTITGNVFTFGGYFYQSDLISNSGLVNSVGGIAIFDPKIAAKSTLAEYDISYLYKDAYGCVDSVTHSTSVYSKISPSISFPDSIPQYCISQSEPILLIGEPSGGAFDQSTPGIQNSNFIPSNSTVGRHPIRYTISDENNCTYDTTNFVVVFPSPTSKFGLSSKCVGDIIEIRDSSSILNSPFLVSIMGVNNIATVKYYVDDISVDGSNLLLQTPSIYNIRQELISNRNCTSQSTRSEFIGAYPQLLIGISKICEGEVTQFKSLLTLTGGGAITEWKWDIGVDVIDSSILKVRDTQWKYDKSGEYSIKLKAKSDAGCVASVTSSLFVLPTIRQFPYVQDFESSNGGWFASGKNSSWSYGKPASAQGFNALEVSANAENKLWSTGLSEKYSLNQQSALNLPCFDFSGLKKPMVNFDLNMGMEEGDGLVLQYSSDDGKNWFPVGDINSGIAWYNNKNIFTDPGEQLRFQDTLIARGKQVQNSQIAWTGSVTGWRNAKNALDDLEGLSNVRLRLSFSSFSFFSDSLKPFFGVGIDNFVLTERNKISLIEGFANANNSISNTMIKAQNVVLNSLSDDIVTLHYHTSVPTSDPFNAASPANSSARVLYYGIEQSPTLVFNGNVLPSETTISGSQLLKSTLSFPPFSLGISDFETNGDKLKANIRLTANTARGEGELAVHIALIERSIIGKVSGAGGVSEFDFVNRQMYPDASGTRYFKSWEIGESASVPVEMDLSAISMYDRSKLGLIAFVQDNNSKTVLQAAYVGFGASPLTNITDIEAKPTDDWIKVYPNPASSSVYVLASKSGVKVELYNTFGVCLKSQSIDQKDQPLRWDVSEFTSGVYLIKVLDPLSGKSSIVKLMLNH